jgi:cysteine desulfurase
MAAARELYLDWNASTPPHPLVLEAMHAARAIAWANPASVHAAGRRARAVLDDARAELAALLERDPRDLVFTGGGTEANNLALAGASVLVTSRLEHPSVTRVADARAGRGQDVRWVSARPKGQIYLECLARAHAQLPAGSVVAVAAVNHETGVLQPLREVSELSRAAGARLHVDAVQAVGRVPRSAWLFGDSVAVAAHKVRGPKGIGALATRPGWVPQPVLLGGSQERGLRPGTVDAVAAAGFAAAVRRVNDSVARYASLAPLRDRLERALGAVARVNGSEAPRAPHVSSLVFEGRRGDELVAALDLEGVRVSAGSACTAGTSEPSAVITAMHDRARAVATLRVSLGEDTREAEVAEFVAVLERILGRGAQSSGAA